MIIVCLMGGLGNQMFQYATGLRLAQKHKTQLKLDLSYLGKKVPGIATLRHYELADFAIDAEPATPQEIAQFTEPVTPGRFRKLCNKVNPFYRQTHIRQQQYGFEEAILSLPDNVYLEGYWQSEKYFQNISSKIRTTFKSLTQIDGKSRELAEQMTGSTSVSVHFRRGDYVSDPNIAAVHGCCSMEYYAKALESMASRVDSPHFFVFSDDLDWVRGNVTMPYRTTFVESLDTNRPSRDLWLMSRCRHHIIANSSFSWWGAWLSHNPGEIVIAPQQWVTNPAKANRDILPDGWLRF